MTVLESTMEIDMLRKLIRDFREKELMPLEEIVIQREARRALADIDEPLIPVEENKRLLKKAEEIGLFGIDVPEEYGGLGLGNFAKVVVYEELFKTIVPFILPPESPNLHMLIQCCNEEQKERYVIPYSRGEIKSNLALTEPNAGSDAGAIKTKAERKGGKWILNGQKTFITGAANADFLITIAVTDPAKGKRGGITAFLIDKGTPGVQVTRAIKTINNDQQPYEVYFENVELDDKQVLGEVGQGFIPLQNRLGVRRLEVGCRSIGMAERALEMMVDYTKQRKTFGTALAERQAIQWWIADSYTDIHATRLMVYDAASKMDQGILDLRKEMSMIKVFGTEMGTKVIDRAIQAHGGTGVTKDLPLEFMYRLMRILRIVEGPTEIHRWQIAKHIINSR